MQSEPRQPRPVLTALGGAVVLLVATACCYALLWLIDFGPGGPQPYTLFGLPDAAETIGGLGEVTVAVLGIVLTVVAIIVELAASRYTPRITELFLKDPVNQAVLSFYAVTSALVIATSMSLYSETYPSTMVRVVVSTMTVSILTILPYFMYVFDFLTPQSVIRRLQARACGGLSMARRGRVRRGQDALATGAEQLGDIALNSVSKKEKAIAIQAIASLSSVARHATLSHSRMPDAWYDIGEIAQSDQDFVSFHNDIIQRIVKRRTWAHIKVLRQYLSVFTDSLSEIQDLAHMIAIHTHQLAVHAVENAHPDAAMACLHFMHTYFRQAINARDVRTAYNVFNEYRSLAEDLLELDQGELVVEIGERFKFYGQLAFSRQLPFILETAAYDLCTLLEVAAIREHPCHDALLDIFLELDREPDGGQHQEASLRGVRKAQIKLATFYLLQGREDLARRIFNDMKHEQPARLISIRDELEQTQEPEFWEVSDRPVNFDWLAPDQRAQLSVFFDWFNPG